MLHWLPAPMILGSLAAGLYMTGLPLSPLRLKPYDWHNGPAFDPSWAAKDG